MSSRLCEGLRRTGESPPSAGWLAGSGARASCAHCIFLPARSSPKGQKKNVVSCHRPGEKIGNEAFPSPPASCQLPLTSPSPLCFAHSTSCLAHTATCTRALRRSPSWRCFAEAVEARWIFEAFFFHPLLPKAPVPHRPCGVRPLLPCLPKAFPRADGHKSGGGGNKKK